MTPEDRFWAKVVRGGDKDCWEWTGARLTHGRAPVLHIRISGKDRVVLASRVSWEIHNGPLHHSMVVRQQDTCKTLGCMNPLHLSIISRTSFRKQTMMLLRAANPAFAQRGAGHPRAKLSDESVNAIRADYATGAMTSAAIAAKHNISRSVVSRIVHNKAWVTPQKQE